MSYYAANTAQSIKKCNLSTWVTDMEIGKARTKKSLCTGSSLYAPYSLLLISNKFWMGGEGGESVGEKRGGRVGGGE